MLIDIGAYSLDMLRHLNDVEIACSVFFIYDIYITWLRGQLVLILKRYSQMISMIEHATYT